jgi:hypothetical protein
LWGIRLLALGIAVGIWFNASVKDRLVSNERVVEAGVRYNRPRGFVLLDPVQSVNVRLRRSGDPPAQQIADRRPRAAAAAGGPVKAGLAPSVVPEGLGSS